MQTVIATVIVLMAAAYMAWSWMPRRRTSLSKDAAPHDAAHVGCGTCSSCGTCGG